MRFRTWKMISGALACTAILAYTGYSTAQEKKKEAKKAESKAKKTEKKAEKKEAKKPATKKAAAKKAAAAVKSKLVVENLENPCGVAVQKGTGHVFVATRYGVYRYVPADKSVFVEIESQNVKKPDVYGKGSYETYTKFDIGPLGVAFMDGDHLVVGDGSRKDGDELVRVYKLPSTGGKVDEGAKEESAAFTLGPIKAGDKSAKGEGNYYGVAVAGGAIFVTCNGDDTKGWIAKAEIKDGKPGKLMPAIATKTATGVDAPAPITATLDGKQIVVGQMGEMNVPGDSLLTFYDPKTGKLLKKYETGLSDIAGLAYSPKTKKLYATDFGWADAANKKAATKDKKPFKQIGGLYELTIKGDKVEKKLIKNFDKPAGIAFSADGKLYIATFGSRPANAKIPPNPETDDSPGGLHVIEGL